MITEAKVEWLCVSTWMSAGPYYTIPAAVERGRSLRAKYLRQKRLKNKPAVRVVDTSGAVVAQWGTP